MDHKEMLRAVASIIAIDGKKDVPEEKQFWEVLCQELDISEKEAAEIYEQAQKGGEYTYIPEDPADKSELFTLLVQAAYTDKEIAPKERKMLKNMAQKIGMHDEAVERIISVSKPPVPLPTGISRAKKKKRKSSTIIAAIIGAVGVVLAAMIPLLQVILSDKGTGDLPLTPASVSTAGGTIVSTMFIKSITVAETRADGKKWDMTGKPDLQIEIENLTSGQKLVTDTQKDTFTAVMNTQVFRVTKSDNLQITVYDADTPGNDVIGKLNQSITQDMLSQKTNTWNFDQVTAFEVEFQPIGN